ncbi:MAG: GatB/YqeY domain-containing protein [Azoarcus sp.]|nr:GatB/YqeY domain-containing protein [Azoarcus sp.]
MLTSYLPVPQSEETVKTVIAETIAALPERGPKAMGAVMAALKSKFGSDSNICHRPRCAFSPGSTCPHSTRAQRPARSQAAASVRIRCQFISTPVIPDPFSPQG